MKLKRHSRLNWAFSLSIATFIFHTTTTALCCAEQIVIDTFHSVKCRHEPGTNVYFQAKVRNTATNGIEVDTTLTITRPPAEVILRTNRIVKLKPGRNINNWGFSTLPASDFTGHIVTLTVTPEDAPSTSADTGLDISSDWRRYPRYGYLSQFDNSTVNTASYCFERFSRHGITALQFYDAHFKHHLPIPEDNTSDWVDIANRPILRRRVATLCDSWAAVYNIKTMHYNLMFGAYVDSVKDGVKPEWGLYKDRKHQIQDAHPLPDTWATPEIQLQDPSNAEWQEYLFNKTQPVFEQFTFTGWHLDQLGDRGTLYRYNGHQIQLPSAYIHFLEEARKRFPDKAITFNSVGGYALKEIAQSSVPDFLYIEAWPWAQKTWNDLKSCIDNARAWSNYKKAVIMAAYMNYAAADQPGEFNEASVLLTDAVIMAAGGHQIKLGDTGMLGKEYFPNDNLKITDDLEAALLRYSNFGVAYQHLLRDTDVRPVSLEITSPSHPLSQDGTPNTIWTFTRKKGDTTIIHLLNLTGLTSSDWRDDHATYPHPTPATNITLECKLNAPVKNIYLASPDHSTLTTEPLALEKNETSNGFSIKIHVPTLVKWGMVIIN